MAQGITYVATDSYNRFQQFCRDNDLMPHHPARSRAARRVSGYSSLLAVTGGNLVVLDDFSGNLEALKIMARRRRIDVVQEPDYAVSV